MAGADSRVRDSAAASPRDVRKSINNFIGYFARQVDQIDAITGPDPQQQKLFRKLLFAVLLDTLSIAARPDLATKNKARFTNFIDSCSAWPDINRVSCWQLKLDLEKEKLTTGPVYKFVESKVSQWPLVELCPAKVDPLIGELQKVGGTEKEAAAIAKHKRVVLLCRFGSRWCRTGARLRYRAQFGRKR
jgi:hypothetical protein